MVMWFVFMTVGFCSYGQKAKIFTLSDFDLKGKVKTCFVIKDYGKEEFSFNEKGILTKLLTRYNEKDYDVTYYKYLNGAISEKRVEIYRDGVFDKQTSIANIYSVDSIPDGKKITEKIVSYAKEFLDQYEYSYDANNQLIQINRNDGNGIENTKIKYEDAQGETTITHIVDGEIQKTIRRSQRKSKTNRIEKVELTKNYFEGEPNNAFEEVFNDKNRLISEQKFNYDSISKSYMSIEFITYQYNNLGMLTEIKTKKGKTEAIKKFIYQYDNGDKGNWVKQIITPDNSYITRKIAYYETVD
jgi:YD repeat-containing protein